jgi:hypothetical protein
MPRKATLIRFHRASSELKIGFNPNHAHLMAIIPDELDHPDHLPKWFKKFQRKYAGGFSIRFRAETKDVIYVNYKQ